jgi:methionyl aminopeptidase
MQNQSKITNIQLKSPAAIEKMRIAGRLAAEVLEMIGPFVQPGVTTLALNDRCHDFIVNTQKAESACLYYQVGAEIFPKSICTSVNYVVCHGIPDEKKLVVGDIINIDVTVKKDGFHGDTSKMFFVGECTPFAKKLVAVTYECLQKAIRIVRPGVKLGDIGAVIQQHAESQTPRYSVVREYCGHGIGTAFHEEALQILHYGTPGTGIELAPGMTFTIEPMINLGKRDIKVLAKDVLIEGKPARWSVAVTKDRSLSAQWEHTLLVTETGVEVLTLREEERPYFS